MNLVIAQQVALDNDLVSTEDRIEIHKCNMRIDPTKTQKEATYQVVLDTWYVVPTGRVTVPAGRYIVPTSSVIVATGRHGLEVLKLRVGGDLTMAEQLVRFIKADLLNAQSAV
uniref:Uncharacterized protein n=1 Tax=Tanacetum cinerariifolium TaxID=118510 RepID=A0A6L2ME75_TANCI|nr:hypothetical protein [Tanacetum cinerariifolium]